jgi:release factor glutamine methyltransferase
MTVRELFDALRAAASAVYDPREAHAAALFLAERIYGVGRLDIATEPAREVAAEGLEAVLHDVADGRPVQYIAGEAWFCGAWMAVGEGVLIPRTETEELVRWVVAEARGARVLDMGTGSGAIAVAVAREAVGSRVTAIDISDRALAVARENAHRAGVEIEFFKENMLFDFKNFKNESPSEHPPEGVGKIAEGGMLFDFKNFNNFDIIVSNPPYIPLSERRSMHRNVAEHEPDEALFVPDSDPLVFYRAIARHGRRLLRHDGRLFLEVHSPLARDVCRLLAAEGYRDVELRPDINGRDRMVRTVIDNQ